MQQVGAHLAPLCPELVSIEELQDRGLLACAVVFGEEVICPIGNSCRVTEANELYINNMALNEKVSSRGGSHWTEHPLDPGCDPYPSLWNTSECKSQNVGQRQWRQTFINVFLVPGAEGHDLRNPLAQDVSAQINHQRFYVIGQGTVSFTFHKFWATCRELFLLTGCWTCRCWKDLLPWKLGAFLAGGFSCFFKSISWWFVCRGLIPSQVLSYLQRTASLTRFTGTWFGKKDLLTWKLGAFLAVWFFAIKFELRGFYLIDRSGKFSLL